MKPLQTFYSVGQNAREKWEVVLVDFWDEDKTSMMVIDEFDTRDEARELGNRLQRELVERESQ